MPEFNREEIVALEIMAALVSKFPGNNSWDLARSAFTAAEAFLYVSDQRKKEAADKAAE